MTVASDVDTSVSSLCSAIQSYTASGGSGALLAQWLISQIKQSDPAVARALDNGITRMVANAPDVRAFASIG
jgi:hypothetical protein